MTRYRTRHWGLVAYVAVAVGACTSPGASASAVPETTPRATASASATESSPSATPLPAPSRSPVVALPGEPWLLFQQLGGGSAVVMARPDGSDLHRPTGDVPRGIQTNPDWSPDGSRFVLVVDDGHGHEDLWVVDADGTDAKLLADCEAECRFLDDPDWAPDRGTILYSRVAGAEDGTDASSLELIDVATGTIEVLVTAPSGLFYAGQRLSPDGRSIVVELLELAGSDVSEATLAIIDVASPSPLGRRLTEPRTFPETAAWAPGGDLIVFGALDGPDGPGPDLFAIAPDGTGLRQLTTLAATGGSATHPDVAPDGASVVFAAGLPARGTFLAAVAIDGGEIGPALGSYVAGVHPRWRPAP